MVRSIEVINGMSLMADSALEDHLVWFVPSDVFCRLIGLKVANPTVRPKTSNCVEAGKSTSFKSSLRK
jgi:hypothetical protein